MTGLPEFGDLVKVWPMPGRLVQDGHRTLDAGGRFLADEGREVVWNEYYLMQYRAGDLLFHAPPKAQPAAKSEPRKFNPAAHAEAFKKAHEEAEAKAAAEAKAKAAPAAPAGKGGV